MNALRKHDVKIYAATTSPQFEDRFRELGIQEIIQVDSDLESPEDERLNEISVKIGGFNYVFDPFFDLHLGKVIKVLAHGGKYITCGLAEQYQGLIGKNSQGFIICRGLFLFLLPAV